MTFSNTNVKRMIDSEYWGQRKINGARSEISVSKTTMHNYTKNGIIHTKAIDIDIQTFLIHVFGHNRWTTIDCEWERFDGRLWIFDILKHKGKLLSGLSYSERYSILQSFTFISRNIKILPVYKTELQVQKHLAKNLGDEGLVFKKPNTIGWPDNALIRMRF